MLHSLRNHKIRVKSDRQCHPPARETTKIHAKEVRQTLKSFASSLHAFNQTYHSLQRSAGALLHHAGVILPALVGLYAVATNLLFIPLMQQLWSLTLRFAPVHYLNNSNASDIFVSPAIILCLVVIALLTAFWALSEFSVLLHGLELARSGRPVQLPALLRDALVDIRHMFLPQNWPVLVYSAVLIPFTSFFLTSNYITQFAVPEYLLGVLRATTRYHALYLAIVVLLVLLFLSCALVLPLFVLERRNLWQAVRESVGFVRQRIFRTALLLLRWNLSAVLRSGSLALCVLAPLYAVILGIGLQNTTAMVALSRASLLVEVPFFQFLLDCSITIAQCSILFLLYRRLRETNY
jgi:glycerophosphoryl diester phosphodiesterase